jgi:membrane protein
MYGAAGSFVIFLIWVYYNVMVIFFGAEFTQVYTNRYGSGVKLGRYVRNGKG